MQAVKDLSSVCANAAEVIEMRDSAEHPVIALVTVLENRLVLLLEFPRQALATARVLVY